MIGRLWRDMNTWGNSVEASVRKVFTGVGIPDTKMQRAPSDAELPNLSDSDHEGAQSGRGDSDNSLINAAVQSGESVSDADTPPPVDKSIQIPNDMFAAARIGDVARMTALINEAERENLWGKAFGIPKRDLIIAAIDNEQYVIVNCLLEKQPSLLAALKAHEMTKRPSYLPALVRLAAANGDISVIRHALSEEPGMDLAPALYAAALMGHQDTVTYLLEKKAHPDTVMMDGETVISAVRKQRNTKNADCIRQLLANSAQSTHTFFEAVYRDQKSTVEAYLEDGMNPDLSYEGATPLVLAIYQRHFDMARLLVNRGASPDVEGDIPDEKQGRITTTPMRLSLHQAEPDGELISMLVPKSVDVENLMSNRVISGDEDSVVFLLEHGFSVLRTVSGVSLLALAAQYHQRLSLLPGSTVRAGIEQMIHILLTKYYVSYDEHLTILRDALGESMASGNADCVRLILNSPIIKREVFGVVARGESDVLHGLLQHGFDKTATNEEGQSLLVVAAKTGQDGVSRVLLDWENDEKAKKQYAESAMPAAIQDGQGQAVTVLLANGADVNVALQLAVSHGREDMVSMTLAHGAEVDFVPVGGESALTLARNNKNDVITRLLTPKSAAAKAELVAAGKLKNTAQVNMLLSQGVDREQSYADALRSDDAAFVETMLACGCKADDVVTGGEVSALTLARARGKPDVIKCLTANSKTAIDEFECAVRAVDFIRMNQLLLEGVAVTAISDAHEGCIGARWRFLEAQENGVVGYPQLADLMNRRRVEQVGLWRSACVLAAKNIPDHPRLRALSEEILLLKAESGSLHSGCAPFVASLEKLRDDLRTAINKEGKHATHDDAKPSVAVTAAEKTTKLLIDLRQPKSAGIDDEDFRVQRVAIVREYENSFKNIPGWKIFLKACAAVCIAAVGFVVGAAVGMGVGVALGAWSGPGAFVTGALGLLGGAYSGAVLGVAVGAAATGIIAGVGSGALLFHRPRIQRDVGDVVSCAKQFCR